MQLLSVCSRAASAVRLVVALVMSATAAGAQVMSAAVMVSAWHPMPNTVIALRIDHTRLTMDIAIPLPELRLAMHGTWPEPLTTLGDSQRRAIEQYLRGHVVVRAANGTPQPWQLDDMQLWEADDENVGHYQELRLRIAVPATDGVDLRQFSLAYDAVIHQIPNHFALVQIIEDLAGGVSTDKPAVDIGVIRYDCARDLTPPLTVDAGTGSRWRAFVNMLTLGFRHVLLGYDHLLFLATLLVVAPLRAVNGRWSLFSGWRYTAQRFLSISLAFTVGHSLALITGAYGLVRIPPAVVETLIAVSILVTAAHAIRPIFATREWLVAAVFGTVHGLAFADALAGLSLGPDLRALAILGFNLGIEAAQLVAMLCAVPLLIASRWKFYNVVRVGSMVVTMALAIRWVIERMPTV